MSEAVNACFVVVESLPLLPSLSPMTSSPHLGPASAVWYPLSWCCWDSHCWHYVAHPRITGIQSLCPASAHAAAVNQSPRPVMTRLPKHTHTILLACPSVCISPPALGPFACRLPKPAHPSSWHVPLRVLCRPICANPCLAGVAVGGGGVEWQARVPTCAHRVWGRSSVRQGDATHVHRQGGAAGVQRGLQTRVQLSVQVGRACGPPCVVNALDEEFGWVGAVGEWQRKTRVCCCRDSYCRLYTAHPRMKGYPKPYKRKTCASDPPHADPNNPGYNDGTPAWVVSCPLFVCAFPLQLVTGNFMYMTVGLLERK